MVVREAGPGGSPATPTAATARMVYSRVTKYYSSIVDLRWCQAIHSCDTCALQQRPAPAQNNGLLLCSAVHYGQCSAVKFTPLNKQNGPRGRAVRIVAKSIKQAQKKEAASLEAAAKLRGETAPAPEVRGQPDGDSAPPSTNKSLKHPPEASTISGKDRTPASATSNHKDRGDASSDTNNAFLRQKEEQLRKRQEEKRASASSPGGDLGTSEPAAQSNKDTPKTVHNNKLSSTSRADNGSSNARTPVVLPRLHKTVDSPGSALLRSAVNVPQFYFPNGKPQNNEDMEIVSKQIKAAFEKFEGGKATKANVSALAKAVGLSLYWKNPLFMYSGGVKNGYVTLQSFLAAWRKLCTHCHDEASKFVRMLAKPGTNHLEEEDFIPIIQDVVETHPGLGFLQDAPEFHSRYIQTVISRIFYCVNRSWSGRITVQEMRRSDFLQTLKLLEEEDDINQITDFFSYEHFYVIYCKFWELDKDHDLYISRDDLLRHNDQAICSRMIDRIFSGAVTRNLKDGKMSYKDFVWFLISEEDKRHPTSIEYWFRCMDLDGDGQISMYEMEYFYEEQVQKMEALGIDTLPFEDCLCQMLDMIKPARGQSIVLADLKACKLTPIFFDTFFNLDKYLEHEQKDPFANVRDIDGDEPEQSDWERYAAEEYEILVAEEGAADMQEPILYEDDFEPDDPPAESPVAATTTTSSAKDLKDPPGQKQQRPKTKSPASGTGGGDDDIYDFSHTKDGNLGY